MVKLLASIAMVLTRKERMQYFYPISMFFVAMFQVSPAESLVLGNPERGMIKAASCIACHSNDGINKKSSYPHLAGRDASYIISQLHAFKSGQRKSDIMAAMASTLSENDVVDVAAYFSSLSSKALTPSTAGVPISLLSKRPVSMTADLFCQNEYEDEDEDYASNHKHQAIKRLSKDEYRRTLWSLIGHETADSLPALAGLISGLPDDDMTGGFANLDWSLSPDHVKSYLGVANEVGTQLATNSRLRGKLLNCSKDNINDMPKACINQFVAEFGGRVYRRKLGENEKKSLINYWEENRHNNPEHAFGLLISRMLMSPHFIFRHESGLKNRGNSCSKMVIDENYNSIARMSYGIWGTMPDKELFTAADDKNFLFSNQLDYQINRMLKQPEAREWVGRFFRQWLHYDDLPIEGYSWDFIADIERAQLHNYAADELDSFINATVWNNQGGFYDLLASRLVITNAPSIRQIYGLPEKSSVTYEEVADNRAGILTRAVMLMNGKDETTPIRRGKFIRQQLLCEPLKPPDASLIPAGSLIPPKRDHRMSTRQRWDTKTKAPLCQSCHSLMNPFGFSLESYDGLGRYRTKERLKIPETSPQGPSQALVRLYGLTNRVTNTSISLIERAINKTRRNVGLLPVDSIAPFELASISSLYDVEIKINTVISPNIEFHSDVAVGDAVELSIAIGKSQKANKCFAKQFATFVQRRELAPHDSVIIQQLASELMQPTGSIYEFFRKYLRHVALSGIRLSPGMGNAVNE